MTLDSSDELFRIRLIACDLDGTLLHGGRREPSDEAFELIEELTRRGVLFLPASGRQYASLRRLFAPVCDELSYLCENGAMVMYQGIPAVRRGFSRPLALQICRAVQYYPYAEAVVSGQARAYVLHGYEEFADHLTNDTKNDMALVWKFEDIDEDILKVAFRVPEKYQADAQHFFENEFGAWANVMTSGNEWTDIVPKGTDKGAALRDFGRLMGIAPQQMAAFGDNFNDYGMLSLVGHPYLMEDCNPSMRGLIHDATYVPTVEGELRRLLDNPGLLGRA